MMTLEQARIHVSVKLAAATLQAMRLGETIPSLSTAAADMIRKNEEAAEQLGLLTTYRASLAAVMLLGGL